MLIVGAMSKLIHQSYFHLFTAVVQRRKEILVAKLVMAVNVVNSGYLVIEVMELVMVCRVDALVVQL